MNIRRLLLVPSFLTAAAACAPQIGQTGVTSPAAGHPWVLALTRAHQAGQGGDFAAADSILASFGERYAGSPEAVEALYWRGFYQLDPANAGGSPARAAAAFREYLAARTPIVHQAEAQVLLRISSRLDSLEAPILAAAPSAGGARPPASAASRDEEVNRLRDELRRTNEELERIRRRLATPRPDEQPATTPAPATSPTPAPTPAQRPPRR